MKKNINYRKAVLILGAAGKIRGGRIIYNTKDNTKIKHIHKYLKKNGVKVSEIKEDKNRFYIVLSKTKFISLLERYKKNNLYFSFKMFRKINFEDISILYLMYGNIIQRSTNGFRLTLNTFTSKENNQFLINILAKKLKINFKQIKYNKKYILFCNTDEMKKFLNIIHLHTFSE